eukprot:g10204.t1
MPGKKPDFARNFAQILWLGQRTCALDVVRRSCETNPASSQYCTARAFLLKFTEKHQKSGKLLPTDSSKDVVENIIKSETAGAKCSFVDHLAASKDELESKAVHKATHFLSHAWSYLFIDVVAAVRARWPSPQEQANVFLCALAGREEKLGATHPDTLATVYNLANLLSGQGKLAEAEPLYRRALAGQEEKLGATHPSTLTTVNNLALLLYDQGKLAEAEPLYRRALAGKEEKLGATHPSTLTTVNNLALLLYDQGKLAEAESLYRRALAGKEEKLGATHPSTLTTAKRRSWAPRILTRFSRLRVSLWTFPSRDA